MYLTAPLLFSLGLLVVPAELLVGQQAPIPDLLACMSVTERNARLDCYDRTALTLSEAQTRGDLAVMNRADIQTTRRRLFGLDVGSLDMFGQSPSPTVDRIEAMVISAAQIGRGAWRLTLDDGSVWTQIDTERLAPPRSGQSVRIRRAAMGSFLLTLGGASAIRVRRDR